MLASVAVSETNALPLNVGVPVMDPVVTLRMAHSGRPEAYHFTAVPDMSEGVLEKGAPRVAVNDWLSASMSEVVADPPPPLAAMVNDTFVAVLAPPGPVAVTAAVAVTADVGVPEIAPVVALIASPAGKPVATQEVAGRLVASVRVGAPLNAVPTVPVKACPAVMRGTPAPITKEMARFALVPAVPVARKSGAEVTIEVGVPVMAPVVALRESPGGNVPEAIAHEVAGPFVMAGVELNTWPTLPVND